MLSRIIFIRMRVALLLLVAVSAVSCLKELDTEWENWKIANKREYADGEEKLRRVIWEDNLVKIQTHNSMESSYTLKMNKFGDMVSRKLVYDINNALLHLPKS